MVHEFNELPQIFLFYRPVCDAAGAALLQKTHPHRNLEVVSEGIEV